MSPRPPRVDRSRRRRRYWAVAGGATLLLILLGVLAIPLLGVPDSAQRAKTDLTSAQAALEAGKVGQARGAVESAREHVDDASDRLDGVGGGVWSALPFIGTPVDDARHLVQALDDATAVAETGVELYPSVAGKQATLFRDGQIDEQTLRSVIAGARDVGDHLESAQRSLDEVRGTTPVVGRTIAARRDEAAAQVGPAADAVASLEPMLDALPATVGFDGERSYLVAMLNPAELRYSGGAALAFAPLFFDDGAVELGDSRTVLEDPGLQVRDKWRKVVGNTFHVRRTRVANSTFAPSWSVSGEELLRAWRVTHNKKHDGVVAVDVVALSKLVGAVGGITVPGYGELTEDNLVQALIGSYDSYYPDPSVQDELNDGLIPAFKDVMFGGGDYVAKAKALNESAQGRHFAVYFRDEEVQEGFAELGLSGDLATPNGDYLGVFTQNVNGSKVDYYQERRLALDVTLAEDGSASHRLDVLVDNATPPYTLPVPDPQFGYFTRYAVMQLGTFFPGGTRITRASVGGEPWDAEPTDFYEHVFAETPMRLEPASTGTARVAYEVPEAASVGSDGDLAYRLTIDPQGTVNAADVEVTVRLPDGFRATSLPTGWASRGGVLTYATKPLSSTQTWEIPIASDR